MNPAQLIKTDASENIGNIEEKVHIDRDIDDPIFHFDIEDVPKKLKEAEDLYNDGDFNTAIGIYCNSLKKYVAKYGEMSLEAAYIYKEYGVCLFEKTKIDSDAFGSDGDGDGDDDEMDDDEEESKENDGEKPTAEGESSPESGVSKENADSDVTQVNSGETSSVEANQLVTNNDGDDDDNNDADLVESDLELSVENLEVARIIYERHIKTIMQKKIDADNAKYDAMKAEEEAKKTGSSDSVKEGESDERAGITSDDLLGPKSSYEISASDINVFGMKGELPLEKYQSYLADVYEALGEASLENESWDRALSDLSRALEIRERIETKDGRALASVHNKLAMYYDLQNTPSKAIFHSTLSAAVFTNRIASKMTEIQKISTELQEKMNESTFGLSTGARPYLLEINLPTAKKIDNVFVEYYNKINRCLLNIADYRNIRQAIEEKIADNQEELSSGLVDDGDGGEKVRKMIKDVLRNDEETTNTSVTTTGFGPASNLTSDNQEVPVQVLQVKRKKPTTTTTTTTTTSTSTTSVPATGKTTIGFGDVIEETIGFGTPSTAPTSSNSTETPIVPIKTTRVEVDTTAAAVEDEVEEPSAKRQRTD